MVMSVTGNNESWLARLAMPAPLLSGLWHALTTIYLYRSKPFLDIYNNDAH